MGLAVVHGIVTGHKGTITLESEPGEGTTFSVLFPVVDQEAVIEIETVEKLPTGSESILFVDDEKSIAGLARQILKRLGYQVETQTSSVDALELFRAKPDRFDLIITDVTMPHMTGDKLVKEILEIRPNMPIVLCTGFSEKITEEKAKELGIKAFVLKPLVKKDFALTVRSVLDKKER